MQEEEKEEGRSYNETRRKRNYYYWKNGVELKSELCYLFYLIFMTSDSMFVKTVCHHYHSP